jgi:hypothetical protein
MPVLTMKQREQALSLFTNRVKLLDYLTNILLDSDYNASEKKVFTKGLLEGFTVAAEITELLISKIKEENINE